MPVVSIVSSAHVPEPLNTHPPAPSSPYIFMAVPSVVTLHLASYTIFTNSSVSAVKLVMTLAGTEYISLRNDAVSFPAFDSSETDW